MFCFLIKKQKQIFVIFDSNNIESGVWQVMEPLHQDHHIVIGHKFINLDVNKMKLFYKEICNRLYELD